MFGDVDGKWKLRGVTNKSILTANDITSLTTTGTVNDYIYFKKPTDSIAYGNLTTPIGSVIGTFFSGETSGGWDTAPNSNKISQRFDNNSYVLFVPKGTYESLAAAKTALTGAIIVYQLATPTITELHSDNQTALNAVAKTYDGVTNIVLSTYYGELSADQWSKSAVR